MVISQKKNSGGKNQQSCKNSPQKNIAHKYKLD